MITKCWEQIFMRGRPLTRSPSPLPAAEQGSSIRRLSMEFQFKSQFVIKTDRWERETQSVETVRVTRYLFSCWFIGKGKISAPLLLREPAGVNRIHILRQNVSAPWYRYDSRASLPTGCCDTVAMVRLTLGGSRLGELVHCTVGPTLR